MLSHKDVLRVVVPLISRRCRRRHRPLKVHISPSVDDLLHEQASGLERRIFIRRWLPATLLWARFSTILLFIAAVHNSLNYMSLQNNILRLSWSLVHQRWLYHQNIFNWVYIVHFNSFNSRVQLSISNWRHQSTSTLIGQSSRLSDSVNMYIVQ